MFHRQVSVFACAVRGEIPTDVTSLLDQLNVQTKPGSCIITRLAYDFAGAVGYEIPADVRSLLGQLKVQAEALGLPKEGDPALEEPPLQPGEDRPQKKLPSDLNPLLAKIAKAAARDNDRWAGRFAPLG